MALKILFVTATSLEASSLERADGILPVSGGYRFGHINIKLLVTGVGGASTSWALKQWLSINDKPDLIINAGIAGSYKDDIAIGDVVMPVSDCFADSGIEDGDTFLTLHEAELTGTDEFPFTDGLILADTFYCNRMKDLIKPVRAITVNTATGSIKTRDRLFKKFNPDIETMEGATFFYICARESVPFLAVRSVSNRVEKRNKKNWNISLALEKLSERINELLLTLE